MAPSPTRSCPACREPLVPQAVPERYGRTMELDTCHRCGGIFFDRDELFRLTRGFVDGKAQATACALASLELTGGGPCPGCGDALTRVSQRQFPRTLRAWQCEACWGMWLSEEDLFEFYQFRRQRIARLKRLEKDREEKRALYASAARDRVMKEMSEEVTKKLLYPAALLAAPTWVAVGLTLAERLAPSLARRLRGKAEDGQG